MHCWWANHMIPKNSWKFNCKNTTSSKKFSGILEQVQKVPTISKSKTYELKKKEHIVGKNKEIK